MYDYTTVDNVYNSYPKLKEITSITSESISALYIVPVESLINAKISKLYAVPVAGTPPLLEMIARDITMYRLLAQRVYPQERASRSEWPDRFKESMDLLNQVANGELTLQTGSGTAIGQLTTAGATPWSNTSGYIPTFLDNADEIDATIDTDKLDDIDALRA